MKIKGYQYVYPSTLRLGRREKVQNSNYIEFARQYIQLLSENLRSIYKNVLMPHYICNVVPEAFISSGMAVNFFYSKNYYHIEISEILEKITKQCIVFIPNYFGCEQDIHAIAQVCKSYDSFLLIDNSQQLDFSNYHIKDLNNAVLNSHRKFFLGGEGHLVLNGVRSSLSSFKFMSYDSNRISTKIKKYIGQHTDVGAVRRLLIERLNDSKDILLPYLDIGYVYPKDIVSVGIPLRLKQNNKVLGTPNGCYCWPSYFQEEKTYYKTLVVPVHKMVSPAYVRNIIKLLIHAGYLDAN